MQVDDKNLLKNEIEDQFTQDEIDIIDTFIICNFSKVTAGHGITYETGLAEAKCTLVQLFQDKGPDGIAETIEILAIIEKFSKMEIEKLGEFYEKLMPGKKGVITVEMPEHIIKHFLKQGPEIQCHLRLKYLLQRLNVNLGEYAKQLLNPDQKEPKTEAELEL